MRFIMYKRITKLLSVASRNKISSILKTCESLSKNTRCFHVNLTLYAKLYKERENVYAYDIMAHNGYAVRLDPEPSGATPATDLEQDWSQESPCRLYETFRKVAAHCSANNLCISHKMFDNFIDSFTDNIQHLTDDQIKDVFYLLNKLPETESIRTRNFIEVWAALDDVCLQRLRGWDPDTMLCYVSLMYMLNLTRVSDFTYKCLQRLTGKAKQLTPPQLVQIMFFMGVLRKSTIDAHNLEVELEKRVSQFSVDELAIMAMGFFKSQTPIRSMPLISAIVAKIIESSKDIHEISLAALLKNIRYSMKLSTDNCVYKLLDSLTPEVARLSTMCCVHIALLGTATLSLHRPVLQEVARAVLRDPAQARIKDLERIVFTFGTFNFIPQTEPPFFETILKELRKPEREDEIKKFGRSFANCIVYLSFVNLHPQDLIHKVLDPHFLLHAYGKAVYVYGREILALHNLAYIYFKNENMNRLNDKTVSILAKKYTDYVPNQNYKKQYNVTERMMLDIVETLERSRGAEHVRACHLLPHYQRGDVVLCVDQRGNPVRVAEGPGGAFGPVVFPPDSNTWVVLVIAGRNAVIRNSDACTGPLTAKLKDLQAMGYHPALVHWNVWSALSTYEERLQYLNKLISEAIKVKA